MQGNPAADANQAVRAELWSSSRACASSLYRRELAGSLSAALLALGSNPCCSTTSGIRSMSWSACPWRRACRRPAWAPTAACACCRMCTAPTARLPRGCGGTAATARRRWRRLREAAAPCSVWSVCVHRRCNMLAAWRQDAAVNPSGLSLAGVIRAATARQQGVAARAAERRHRTPAGPQRPPRSPAAASSARDGTSWPAAPPDRRVGCRCGARLRLP